MPTKQKRVSRTKKPFDLDKCTNRCDTAFRKGGTKAARALCEEKCILRY